MLTGQRQFIYANRQVALIAAIAPDRRNWAWDHFAALWLGMVNAVPAYPIPATMLQSGMSALPAVITVLSATLMRLGRLKYGGLALRRGVGGRKQLLF